MVFEISCLAPPESVFHAGELAILLVKAEKFLDGQSSEDDNNAQNFVVFAQFHGHLKYDPKWLKSKVIRDDLLVDDSKNENEQALLDRPSTIPVDPLNANNPTSTICVFCTQKIPLSFSHLISGGALVETFLPRDIMPSCKARLISVHYFLTIQIQHADWNEAFHFPITFQGQSPKLQAYRRLYSGIVSYPISNVPTETTQYTNTDLSLDQAAILTNEIRQRCDPFRYRYKLRAPSKISNLDSKRFNVGEEDHICKIFLPTTTAIIGGSFILKADFTENEEECIAVKTSLIMTEVRHDESIVQSKLICSEELSALHAEDLEFNLFVPSSTCCSSSYPLAEIKYHLLIEFHLHSHMNDDPVSFEIPILMTSWIQMVRNQESQFTAWDDFEDSSYQFSRQQIISAFSNSQNKIFPCST